MTNVINNSAIRAFVVTVLTAASLVMGAASYGADDADENSHTSTIPEIYDIRVDARDASTEGSLILVITTVGECTYCEFVKSDFLQPLIASGDLNGVALVRELPLEGQDIKDFDGESIDARDFADRYDARFSPTVLFLNADGESLHAPIVGVQSRDFYGFYLEKAIKQAHQKIRLGS